MPEYHAIMNGLIVKPVNEPIFSDKATMVELDDEAAGLFIVIRQSRDDGDLKISLTKEEWPLIRDAVEEMLHVIETSEKKESTCQ